MRTIHLKNFTSLANPEMKSIIGGIIKTHHCTCTVYKQTNNGIKKFYPSDADWSGIASAASVDECLLECMTICDSTPECFTYDFNFTASGSKS